MLPGVALIGWWAELPKKEGLDPKTDFTHRYGGIAMLTLLGFDRSHSGLLRNQEGAVDMIRTVSALVSLGLIGFSGAALASTTTTTKAPVVAIGSGTIVAQNLGNEGVSEGGAGSG